LPEHSSETQDRILDAAEQLFSEQGVAATSLRSITQLAGVNTAAIHYHFGSKTALVEEIVGRRIKPLNRERLKRLEELEKAAGSGSVELERLLEAFLGPVVAARTEWGEAARKLGALMARLRIEEADLEEMLAPFQDLHDRYALALARALPDLAVAEATERLDYAVGAMIHILMHPREDDSEEPAAAASLEHRFERMIHFLAAGFRAPSESMPAHPFAKAKRVADQGARP